MLLDKYIALLALGVTTACQARSAMRQVESVERATLANQGWSRIQAPATEQEITLEIGLTLQNTDKLINTLLDVSNPKSKNYGQWLDKASAEAIIKPKGTANEAVVNWLKSEGVTQIHTDGTWIKFVANIGTANRLLAADYQQYEREGVRKIRTTSYSVPEDLMEHIDIIHPTTFFGQTRAYKPTHIPRERTVRREIHEKRQLIPYPVNPAAPPPKAPKKPTGQVRGDKPYFKVNARCAKGITPGCIRDLYNVGNYTPSVSSGSKIAFSSFLNQSYQYEDLRLFQKTYKLPFQNATKIFVNNAVNSQEVAVAQEQAGEANLDAQNMLALAAPLPVFEYLTGGQPPFVPDLEMKTPADNTNEPYVPYYQYLLSLDNENLPSVISNSYGEPEQTVPPSMSTLLETL